MMKELRLEYPIPFLSRVFDVSASGYFAWVSRPVSNHAKEEARLEVEIQAAHERTRGTYGPERLQKDLAAHGVKVGVSRIKRIRKKLGIPCKQTRRFKVTTDSRHTRPVADNLLQQDFQMSASMSGTGNCYDNAPMESFWGMLKSELVYHRRYKTRQEAVREITEYIEVFYNRQRRQARLGYLSPAAFEKAYYMNAQTA